MDIAKDVNTDNIILAQAARHVIVHCGAVVDTRFTRQVAAAPLRTLKRDGVDRGQLAFTPAEVETVATSMRTLVEGIIEDVRSRDGQI